MIRLYAETLRLLKIVAAMRQESMIECIHLLVTKEAEKLKAK